MLKLLEKLKDEILDILFPKFCIGCGREGLYICKDCEVFLSEVLPSPEVTSAWEYEGLIEKLIYKIKFDGCYHIIDELVERALSKIDLILPEDTVITYVPMYRKREKRRGFNQSSLFAQKLGFVLSPTPHKPIRVLELLRKVKDNKSQVGLGPKEREENVRGVFEFQGSFVPENVLLVDDVYTTGSTMKECAKVLKKSGVKNVRGFTIARQLRL
jgi:competence protein ComFC